MCRDTLYKYMSRLLACLLVMVLLITAVPCVHAEGQSGVCGENLTWSFAAGTLTISGSGEMTDYYESTMAPWYSLREQILRLELPEELTSVGSLAFYGCEELLAVTIPNGVTRIGSYAFAECSNLTMLTLGSGITEIGECAFSDCVSLNALRLPENLRIIGMKAFYRCESIPAVTVPASVQSIGMSAFAYCKGLVSAQLLAHIDTIPEWLFYGCAKLVIVTIPDDTRAISEFAFRGCEQLTTVYYNGSSQTPEQIQQTIGNDIPSFDNTGYVSTDPAPETVISGTAQENTDGTTVQQNTTVTQTPNSTVTTTVETIRDEEGNGVSTSVEIQVTIENEEGWGEADDVVDDALQDFSDNAAQVGDESNNVEITVYIKDDTVPDPEFVEDLSGRDAVITIISQDGSSWRIDSSALSAPESEGQYDLRYTLTAGTAELCAELGVVTCYVLRFLAPAQINAEMLIRLDKALSMQNATLLQRDEELKQVQSVAVDQKGYAHFYLASVTENTDYYIAINMPQIQQEVIIPDELLSAYGNPERHTPIQYEITGRKSSWGMSFGQVTGIMVAVLVVCVAAVGILMFALNKRKLKMGYVPDLDEEDIPKR